MKGFITIFTLFLVALAVSEVISQAESEYDVQPVDTQEIAHGHRSKRSPNPPLLAPLLLGKSFLLGAFLGPKLIPRGGWGHGIRYYSGWSRPSRGWGWSSPVITVSHSHGWGW